MLMMAIPSYPTYLRLPLSESSDLKWGESEEGSPGMEADASTDTGQTFLFPIESLFNEGSPLKAYPEVPSDQSARGSTRHMDRTTIVHIATRAEGDLSSSSDYEEDSESMMSEATSESESGSEETMEVITDTGNIGLNQKLPSPPTIKEYQQLEGDPETPAPTKKTKRGKTKNQIGTKAKGKRKSKDRWSSLPANSVRSIPCFYADCAYSYKRPGSTIVEISDRPLLLGKKFDGYTIRACKKHHDKWKHKEKRGSCDVCRGLNVSASSPSVNTYINNNHTSFNLCDHCYHKQCATLNLQRGIVSTEAAVDPVDGVEGDYEEEGRSSRRGSMDNQSSNSPTLNHAKESLPSESHPYSFKLTKKEPGSDKYIVYRKTTAPGWNLVKGVIYLPWTIWDESVVGEGPSAASNRILYLDQQPPFQFTIRKIKDDLALFSDNNIPPSTCLGEYTGTVVDGSGGTAPRFSASLSGCSTSCPLRIDAQQQGNEFRFLAAIPDREPNVYLQQVDGVLLVFAAAKINKGDQLILKPQPPQEQEEPEPSVEYEEADSQNTGSEPTTAMTSSAEKENHYLSIFKGIEEYNKENLSPEEMESSAFYWLIQDGYKILNQKGKITVPIDKRLPSKKSIANNHSIKKTNGILKTDVEWGYVAQLERLDLERAREDCWVTFKASRHWDYDAFLSALKKWKRTQDIGEGSTSHTHIGKAPAHQNSPKKLSPSAVNPSPKKRKLLQEDKLFPKEPRTEKTANVPKFHMMALPPPPAPVYNVATRQLDEVMYSDLSIKFDGALLGSNGQGYAHVFKGYWKGYPVAARFPALKIPVGEDQRKQFIEACAISAVVHPNIVTSYGCCKKDQLCLVMELMNLGSLKQWLVKTPAGVQAMYIPRIALDIARGVDYIHSKHICHGNLKSSNILLKGELLDQGLIANLEVKIGDLGVIPDHLLKKADTEHFLAPEYFRTKYNSYEADVYSFGKILCHLFSEGKEEPKSPQEVISTSQYLQIWDPKWKELIVGCTQLDAAKRPRFSDIVDSLVALLDSSKL